MVNFSGVASPRPRVGWTAKAPTDSSTGVTGVQRSLAPLPSELKDKCWVRIDESRFKITVATDHDTLS